MKFVNLRLALNAEPFLEKVFSVTERLINLQFFDVPILHMEPAADGESLTGTVVYMHSIRREREGFRCRFFLVAYTHKQGETPPKGPVQAYIMEYPLIQRSSRLSGWEYTVPTLEHPWAN